MQYNFYTKGSRKLKTLAAALVLMALPQAAKADVAITEENFPDENLREIIRSNGDWDGDGTLSDYELGNFTSISINANVKNFKGLELLPNLTGFNTNYSLITSLDFNKIECSKNFTSVYVYQESELTSLDLTPLTNVTELYIYNCGQLTELKLGNYPKLRRLTLEGLSEINSIDLSSSPALDYVSIQNAGKDINLQNCPALKEAHLTIMPADLKSINLSGCSELQSLDLGAQNNEEYPNYTLNIDGCDKLNYLSWSGWAGTDIDLSQMTSLSNIYLTNTSHLSSLKLPENLGYFTGSSQE